MNEIITLLIIVQTKGGIVSCKFLFMNEYYSVGIDLSQVDH